MISDTRMTGGTGADTFVIYGQQRFGEEIAHVITDFRPGDGDRVVFLEVPGVFVFFFVNFSAMLNETLDTPAGAEITWRNGSVTLAGVSKASLDAGSFQFQPAVDLF
jgi:hypothetical protein